MQLATQEYRHAAVPSLPHHGSASDFSLRCTKKSGDTTTPCFPKCFLQVLHTTMGSKPSTPLTRCTSIAHGALWAILSTRHSTPDETTQHRVREALLIFATNTTTRVQVGTTTANSPVSFGAAGSDTHRWTAAGKAADKVIEALSVAASTRNLQRAAPVACVYEACSFTPSNTKTLQSDEPKTRDTLCFGGVIWRNNGYTQLETGTLLYTLFSFFSSFLFSHHKGKTYRGGKHSLGGMLFILYLFLLDINI